MTQETIGVIIREVLRETMESQNLAIPQEGITSDMPLIGSQSVLDSMTFVMLTAGVEQRLSEQSDVAVTIVNEKAMSMRNSPFRTVGTLTDYVFTLTQEASVSAQKA